MAIFDVFRKKIAHSYTSQLYPGYINQSPTPGKKTAMLYEIIEPIVKRIATDVSMLEFTHEKLVDGKRIEMDSSLNKMFKLEPNLDFSPDTFIISLVIKMLLDDKVAIVPLSVTDSFSKEPYEYRLASINQFIRDEVEVTIYSAKEDREIQIFVKKENLFIFRNLLPSIKNNFLIHRYIDKLKALDDADEKMLSNRLNILVQLPHVVKTDIKRQAAEDRIKALEQQMENNKYGVGYIDALENVIQLNRSIDPTTIQKEVDDIYNKLLHQFNLTQEILNGTANESTMLNYYERTIEPIARNITYEIKRKALTKHAITQGQTISYYRNPFNIVPINALGDVVDKLTRNAILTPNEVREILGYEKVDTEEANELRNRNISDRNQNGNERMDYEY